MVEYFRLFIDRGMRRRALASIIAFFIGVAVAFVVIVWVGNTVQIDFTCHYVAKPVTEDIAPMEEQHASE